MLEWLTMGGYGAYIWGAYVFALGGLAATTAWTLRAHAKAARTFKAPESEP